MSNIRLLELLIKLRVDELDRYTNWQNAVLAKAKVSAERARKRLNNAQRGLIDEVFAGRLPEVGHHIPDPRSSKTAPKGWIKGLNDKDEWLYLFYQRRGNPNSLACRTRAERQLREKDAPEWQRHSRSLWTFVIEKLWHDCGCLCYERGEMFKSLRLFDEVLCEAVRRSRGHGSIAVKLDDVTFIFLREQDKSGYTEELVAALWAEYRSDCETIGLEKPVAVGDKTAADANRPDLQITAKNGHTLPLNKEGEWSAPMSLSEMARRITGNAAARGPKVRTMLERYGLEPVSEYKWMVRLDTMDAHTRKKMESPA